MIWETLAGLGGGEKSHSSYAHFREKVKETSVVYGFDLYAPPEEGSYPNQKQGDIQEGLPYPDNFFNTVYMGELIEHLDKPSLAVDEIYRVLKNDGVFILDTPNPYSLFRIGKYLIRREENLGDPTHILFYTPASLKAFLEIHNFTIETLNVKLSKKYRLIPSGMIRGLGSNLLVAARKGKNSKAQ